MSYRPQAVPLRDELEWVNKELFGSIHVLRPGRYDPSAYSYILDAIVPKRMLYWVVLPCDSHAGDTTSNEHQHSMKAKQIKDLGMKLM